MVQIFFSLVPLVWVPIFYPNNINRQCVLKSQNKYNTGVSQNYKRTASCTASNDNHSNKSYTLVLGMKGASPSSFFKSTNSCANWRHKWSISLNILKICLFVYHLSNCIICFQYNGNILIMLTISWLSLKFCNLLCSKADNLGKSSSFASFGVFGFFVACFFSILTLGISFLSNFTTLQRKEYLGIQTYE